MKISKFIGLTAISVVLIAGGIQMQNNDNAVINKAFVENVDTLSKQINKSNDSLVGVSNEVLDVITKMPVHLNEISEKKLDSSKSLLEKISGKVPSSLNDVLIAFHNIGVYMSSKVQMPVLAEASKKLDEVDKDIKESGRLVFGISKKIIRDIDLSTDSKLSTFIESVPKDRESINRLGDDVKEAIIFAVPKNTQELQDVVTTIKEVDKKITDSIVSVIPKSGKEVKDVFTTIKEVDQKITETILASIPKSTQEVIELTENVKNKSFNYVAKIEDKIKRYRDEVKVENKNKNTI